ncbi:MAG: UDP-N-acetylmuramoyl-tripeptide--D-alanyl-D-alanine ligase [bacterium]
MQLSEAATITRGVLRGVDARFDRVVIDSRCVRRGDLFVAIRGACRDGHDFIAQADAQGAVGAMVSRAQAADAGLAQDDFAQTQSAQNQFAQTQSAQTQSARIEVEDTTAALGALGAHWRGRFDLPLIAVTGSNGKTTVVALIAAILNHGGDCLAPRASFNNQWGVPLTLLRLRARHTHAVIEMGMNRAGEIARLSALASPTVALINNVAPAHLAGLDSLQGIADAKAEILGGLARGGVAVLNADDRFYQHWRQRLGETHSALRFGLQRAGALPLDATATGIRSDAQGSEFELIVNGARARVRLALLGRHNVQNAVAAAACAHAAGADLQRIQAGLESFAAIDGRLRAARGLHGALILDDTYNANPDSIKAALEVLATFDGERVAVLGAMAELGAQSDVLHCEVAAHARQLGIERLLCVGAAADRAMASYLRGFGACATRFDDCAQLLRVLAPTLGRSVTVLVKGSRAAAMERVAAPLLDVPSADANNANSEEGASC